jgi:hypothetical protein
MAKLPTSDSRAHRFRLRLPLQYRGKSTDEWRSGTIENISLSGVLFRAPEAVPPRSPIEFSLVLPRRLSGPAPLRIFGKGYVVRTVRPALGMGHSKVATSFMQLMLSPPGAMRYAPESHRGVSYSIFNNLAVALGSSELLLDRQDLPPEVRAGLARLQSAVLALATNVRELAQ